VQLPDPLTREPREPDVGSAEDWNRIEKELGFSNFDPRRREWLSRWIDLLFSIYLRDADIRDVRPADMRRALAALKRHATRLFVDLSPSGRLLQDSFLREQPFLNPNDAPKDKQLDEGAEGAMVDLSLLILPSAKRKQLLKRIAELITAVDKESQKVPKDRGGRGSDWRMKGFVKELSRLYAEVSGRKPGVSKTPLGARPGGPFFRFVKACLQIYAPHRLKDDENDEALAKTIQRVLKIKNWQRTIAL
jgi:hypothetical protein